MKTIILSTLIALSFINFSCDKDNETPDPKSVEEYLTAETWRMDEITYLQGGTSFGYYKRGVAGGGAFLNDRIKYEANGTGAYFNTYDEEFAFTWTFVDSEKTQITLSIKNIEGGRPATGKNLEVRLDNVTVTDAKFRYTELFTEGGQASMSSIVRTPL